MKCSEALKKLDEELIIISETGDTDFHDAISLAIGCLKFRLGQTQNWASSKYTLLPGEDREEPSAHEK